MTAPKATEATARLRDDVAELGEVEPQGFLADVIALLAERDRYKAALEEIEALLSGYPDDYADIARRALGRGEP
jgi:hypothetical protein